MVQDGDLLMRSTTVRPPRLIPINTWVDGYFGAKRRNIMVVRGETAEYYLDGIQGAPRVENLTKKDSINGETVYEVSCHCYDNSGHTVYEYPVDTILFNVSGSNRYYFELLMYKTQRCMVINTNNNADNVYIYSNGRPVEWKGGEMAEVIRLPLEFINPSVSNIIIGAGVVVGAFRDNDW